MIPDELPKVAGSPAPTANPDYLDVAVLLEMWKRWDLSGLLDELMPLGDALVAPAAVVAALAIQRCVAPSPKGYTPSWFRKTALPELLGVPLGQFNNTRLHRVLDALDSAGPSLMERLPRLYTKREGKFVTLFLDVTDSWFVGQGPSNAQPAKTKEGRFERKINIVLLCNEKGYPLRWETVPGRQHDSKTMLGIFEALRGLSWASDVPVVCDRALGNTAHLRRLSDTGVHFLTALTRNEFASYTDALPYQSLLDFTPTPGDKPSKDDIKRVADLAEAAGLKKVDDDLYLLDLGVVTYLADRPKDQTSDSSAEPAASSESVDESFYRQKDIVAVHPPSSTAALSR